MNLLTKISTAFFIFLLPFGLMAQNEYITHYNNGVKAYNNFDNFAAMSHYNKSIAANPDYANAYYGRGLVHKNGNKLEEAIADFEMTLEKDATYVKAYELLGLCYHDQKNYQEAIKQNTAGIKVAKDAKEKARLYHNRAWAYDKLLDNKNTLADFEAAVKLQPKNGEYQYLCGRAKFAVGGKVYNTAIDNFNAALAINSKHKEALIERATYYMTNQKFEKALVDLKGAKAMGSTEVDHLIEAAEFELKMIREEGE